MKQKLILLFTCLSSCLFATAQEDSCKNDHADAIGSPTDNPATLVTGPTDNFTNRPESSTMDADQPVSLSDDYRHVVRSTMVGAGFSNVFDTYLSPLEYKGPEVRFLLENMKMTRLMGGKVSSQHLFQINFSYTKNPNKAVKSYSGLVNWSYALHYQKQYNERLKILFGPMIDVNAGVIYNQRNSNNPAQAKAYASLGASAMAIYKFHIGHCPVTLRYQANLPLMGIMFSPEYGESYYEIFELKNGGKNVLFTSLHNMPSLRQMVTFDVPVKHSILRIGYICDIQQAKVNNLKSHMYGHDFMVGVVRNLYLLKGKRHANMRPNGSPF